MALGWFKPDLLLANNSNLSSNPSSNPSFNSSKLCLLWMENYQEFVLELQTNFGPYDLVSNAEHQLCHLSLKDEPRISKYVVEFNCLACQLGGYCMEMVLSSTFSTLDFWTASMMRSPVLVSHICYQTCVFLCSPLVRAIGSVSLSLITRPLSPATPPQLSPLQPPPS